MFHQIEKSKNTMTEVSCNQIKYEKHLIFRTIPVDIRKIEETEGRLTPPLHYIHMTAKHTVISLRFGYFCFQSYFKFCNSP